EGEGEGQCTKIFDGRIKDVEFIDGNGGGGGGSGYAKIVVNGKTGERSLPLIDSIPYVTQWISNHHPQGSNREAILLPNIQTGKAIQVDTMLKAYNNYKSYFTSLLSSEDVPEDDKKKIRDLLKKRWNPYVHRHSAITEKSGLLADSKLRQYAGWTPRSNMHYKYVHFSGGESMKDLLKAKGILQDDKQVNVLQPKTCPNCREPNKPDAQFCFKCNFVMSFEVYQNGMEEREKKDLEIYGLKEQMYKMQQDFKSYDESVKEVFEKVKENERRQKEEDGRHHILYDMLDKQSPEWREKYHELLGIGPKPLTKEARKKIEELLDWMRKNPEDDALYR
ncbi:MAG: zinc ribbon domain-containing protein, partial [Candidatus Nitrosopolaris sp.]